MDLRKQSSAMSTIKLDTCKRKVWGFNDIPLVLICTPIVSFMVHVILFRDLFLEEGFVLNFKCMIISIMYVSGFWLIFREIHYKAVKKYPSFDEIRNRYLYLVITSVIAYIVVDFFLDIIAWKFMKPLLGVDMKPGGLLEVISSSVFILLFLILYEAMYLSNMLKKTILEKEILVKENLSSQLEGLRSQVNPHFLFNSLNTLSSLIPEDPQRANRFVSQMSKVYRYLLEFRNESVVLLKDELEFIDSYSFMIKERFQNNIILEQDIGEEYHDYMIIPLSLQILYENAIKHNVISRQKNLLIKTYIENKHLVVENNLQLKKTMPSSTKVGLKNIIDRYSFFTEEPVKVTQDDLRFKVSLPLFKKKTDSKLAEIEMLKVNS